MSETWSTVDGKAPRVGKAVLGKPVIKPSKPSWWQQLKQKLTRSDNGTT